MQEQSFSNFLYRDGDRVGFGEAKKKLEQYANYFNRGVIPNYLACVEKAGGANHIRSKWNQNNNAMNSQSNSQYNSQYNSQVNNNAQYNTQYNNQLTSQYNNQYTNAVHPNTIVTEANVYNSNFIPKVASSNSGYFGTAQDTHFYQSQTFAPRSRSRIEMPTFTNARV